MRPHAEEIRTTTRVLGGAEPVRYLTKTSPLQRFSECLNLYAALFHTATNRDDAAVWSLAVRNSSLAMLRADVGCEVGVCVDHGG